MNTLFEQLGGAPAVDLAVDRFYDKVLADERIQHFFTGVDMARQRRHQKNFFTYAFGGAANYSGQTLRVAHRRMVDTQGLADTHFDAVVENLKSTLVELNVADALIDQVIAITESARNDVLGR
ncbi:MAG: group 1 truncated hemoglobin [Pseudomonadota bacterium]